MATALQALDLTSVYVLQPFALAHCDRFANVPLNYAHQNYADGSYDRPVRILC